VLELEDLEDRPVDLNMAAVLELIRTNYFDQSRIGRNFRTESGILWVSQLGGRAPVLEIRRLDDRGPENLDRVV
jgi:hypothetical protein